MASGPRNDISELISILARSPSGRLLHDELGRRWPETEDRLPAIARYALLPPGKLLRSIMTLHSAEAVGGRGAEVLPAALGMEYLHVATLVHDDIIDGDPVRRGRPAVPVAYGLPDAIVAGDHLIFAAFGSIAECAALGVPAELVAAAMAALAAAGADLCRGQAMEAALAGDPQCPVASYLEVARLKTGALFRAACLVGGLLGGADPATAAALAGYGEHVGVAFQISDDLLPYVTPAEVAGKAPGSDLTNGRPTLPVLLAYRDGDTGQRRQLAEALRAGAAAGDSFELVGRLLLATGAVQRSRQRAEEHARLALAELAAVRPGTAAGVLAAIARWTSARER